MNDNPKLKRQRLTSDKAFLKKLISILEKEIMTKEQLAEKLGLDNAKKISDSVLLAAIKLSGNSIFLDNLSEKTTRGRVKKGPHYSQKKGLVVPSWMFEGMDMIDGQKFTMSYGKRKGIITLKPIDKDSD
jgi:hypothetical protein